MLRYIKHYNLIVIIVASVLCMGNAQKINTQQKLSEATDLLKKREYIKSIEVCDSIIRENPDYVDSYLVKGYALSAINKNKEAIDAYDMAIKYKPNFAEAYNEKATILGELGEHKEAINACDMAIKYKPDLIYAYINKGLLLANINKNKEAIDVYDMAIRYKQESYLAHYSKGNALSRIKNYQEAIKSYDMALKYNPQYEDAKYNKAVALSHIGKHKEAGELYMELWDDESLDEYKKALERAEHIDLNGQHVVIIPKKESKQTKSRSIGNKKTTKEKGSKHNTSP